MIAGLGGAGDALFAIRVVALVAAGRRNDDRAVELHAEEVDAHVDLAHVDQAARPQLVFQETLAVGAQRDLVVDAGGHVAEVRRRHVLRHYRLEIEDVDGFLRVRDQLVEGARRPDHRIGQQARPLGREGGEVGVREQRARGQELQEFSTCDVGRHGGSSRLQRAISRHTFSVFGPHLG
jgi:hypothetical protein